MLKKVDHIQTCAHLTDEVTPLEMENYKRVREAASEAIVLLENRNALPLTRDMKIAMFGEGVTHTVKCGSGSGEVNDRRPTPVYEGMKNAGADIVTAPMLEAYGARADKAKTDYLAAMQKKAGFMNFQAVSMANISKPFSAPSFPRLSEKDLPEADACVYVISRISGESYDRELTKGDYYLTETEEANICLCRSAYSKLILVINAGGMVDIGDMDDARPDAVLFMAMLGSAGGDALADVLFGDVSPSGHLTATWPMKYEDIPYAKEYSYLNHDVDREYYREDIFVGYRYFDTFSVEPRYPFGYGLSYTTFSMDGTAALSGDTIRVTARVKNTGEHSGKEVVQVYVSCPDGKLQKEYQRLVGFQKTELLRPDQEQTLILDIPLGELGSYDEKTASMLLEAGCYLIRLGNSSRNTRIIAAVELASAAQLSCHDNICPANAGFSKLSKFPEAVNEPVPSEIPRLQIDPGAIVTVRHQYPEPAACDDPEVGQLLQRLTDDELALLVVGCGNDMVFPMEHTRTVPGATGYSTYKLHKKGIADIAFCDGPAGIRVQQQAVAIRGKNKIKAITPALEMLSYLPKAFRNFTFGKPEDGTMLYQYTTALPVGTALAQTWNTALIEKLGQGVNAELEEYGIDFWLAPGLNIQRNPLCGRNYEYYSEDPVLSGKIAAAMARGAQVRGSHSVTLKHFFCNNQETNRGNVSSEVSERAIREIYLKGFEIGVKEGHAGAVMTSYNRVNNVFSAVNRDALIKVLRDEWGFDGLVMTDWDTTKPDCDAEKSMEAGVSILMQVEKKQVSRIRKAMKEGTLDPKYVRRSASHVLRAIIRSNKGD